MLMVRFWRMRARRHTALVEKAFRKARWWEARQ